jgi:hypothetical protein
MVRKFVRFTALCAIAGTVILSSCLEGLDNLGKIDKTSFEPIIDFPLVNSDFTMQEFLTGGKSKGKLSEQNGVLVLTYDDSLATPLGDSFFSIPDQQSPTLSITGPEVSFSSPGTSVTVTKSLTFDFSTSSSESLDSVWIKAGKLQLNLSSNFPANIQLNITIPSLKIQRTILHQNVTFNGPGNESPSIDLQNAVADLTAGGTTSNKLTLTVQATITDTGTPLNSTHKLTCDFAMDNLAFRALFGDLNTQNYQLKGDSINVDVFDNSFSGTVDFLAPAVDLTLVNSFGLPIALDIHGVTAVKQDGSVIALSGNAVSAPLNPYLVSAPDYNHIGQSVASAVSINSSNSNLSQLISSLPRYLTHQLGVTLNPAGASRNFVLDDSRISVKVHLELPFYGKVSALTLSRTYDFNGLGIDDVQQGSVVIKTSNELPLDAAVQAYFIDENGTTVDSLFTNPTIAKGAAVDGNGFTQGPAELSKAVTLTQDRVDRINQAKHLVLVAILNTTNGGTIPVKFSATDEFQISIGVSTRVKYSIN